MRRLAFLLTSFLISVFLISEASASPYPKGATWRESMEASKAALLESYPDLGALSFRSEVMKGGQDCGEVEVDLKGVKTLHLIAEIGPDDYHHDRANWVDPVLIRADGGTVRLGDLEAKSVSVGWGELKKDAGLHGKIMVNGKSYEHGLFAHAPSELVYSLPEAFQSLRTGFGIDGNDTRGSVVFVIQGDCAPFDKLWRRMHRDFPEESKRFEADCQANLSAWFLSQDADAIEKTILDSLRGSLHTPPASLEAQDFLGSYLELAQHRDMQQLMDSAKENLNFTALRASVENLMAAFPDHYPNGPDYLKELEVYAQAMKAAAENPISSEELQAMLSFRKKVLLDNPWIQFERLLAIRRDVRSPKLGLPQNWQGNCSLPASGFRDELIAINFQQLEEKPRRVFKPKPNAMIADLDLHFDADRMLFSMRDKKKRWQIFELSDFNTQGFSIPKIRKVSLGEEKDVDNYDACYLPDGRIIYDSTACYVGIPCVFGGDSVANLCIMNNDGGAIRQLCFDQDHDWCPTVLNNGRVMYLRWEYSGLPHSNSRILFHMNPDGTGQMEYYGSNSYWPNSLFFARPLPNHPSKIIGVVGGHHGAARMGELVIFDPALGRREAAGAVQRIPGYQQGVKAVVRDRLVDESWPRFLHPWPLSDEYFLVSCQPAPDKLWGLYLVDIFDNMLLLHEEKGQAIFEPTPLVKRPTPPAVPDKVRPEEENATIYIADIYKGDGLKGVTRGSVKALRLITYAFSYRHMGGLLGFVGLDGPWDMQHVLGTVPVAEDGSAFFEVPANTPIAVQPLDEKGRAMQLMRSWFSAMPGETLSCVGCHESQNTPAPVRRNLAAQRRPDAIKPWFGAPRGFAFAREVQPVLDAYCLKCHNGEKEGRPDLRGDHFISDWNSQISGHGDPKVAGKYSHAYAALHRYVRRPGIESDAAMFSPLEFHANTTELAQLLEKGHHEVQLDPESWDRIYTWIDLNAPYFGTWTEILGERRVKPIADRKRELRQKYAGKSEDLEWIPDPIVITKSDQKESLPTSQEAERPNTILPAAATEGKPAETLVQKSTALDLGNGVSLSLVPIPAKHSESQAEPAFWMGQCEITNAQFAQFDPQHDSREESRHGYQFGCIGYPVNTPSQPVVRVSWEQAQAFCLWLSEKTGASCTLPSAEQWEWACRAGSSTPFYFGDLESDFTPHANLGDIRLKEFAACTARGYYTRAEVIKNPNQYDDWVPRDTRYDDGAFLSAPVGSYAANPWGLFDMHGNVWEWTLSPAPEAQDSQSPHYQVCGGSWYDRPKRCTADYRLAFAAYQPVFNVGFRIVIEAENFTPPLSQLAKTTPKK